MRRIRHSLILHAAVAAIAGAALGSCIENDVPPPQIRGEFKKFEVEGQTKEAVINPLNRTVTVDLEETVDPKAVRVSDVELSETGTCDIGAGSVIDLSAPLRVVVKTQAEYEWTITATQTIERRFIIENQVGESYFEEHSHSVFAYVPAGTDMTKINILDIKLGPEGQTTMTPSLSGEVSFRESTRGDGTRVREVTVEYRDVREEWSLYVAETESGTNEVDRKDIWATFATVTAVILDPDGSVVEFAYRKAGTATWYYHTAEPGDSYGYSARITGLEPGAGYEVCVCLDGELVGSPVDFTTEEASQPRNPGFEEYGDDLDGAKKLGYYFYSNIADKFWDCGNQGSMTLNKSVTSPSADVRPGSGGVSSVYLKSQYVSVLGIGKFAAGNIYSGEYAGTVGTNGKVDFGREFTFRPSAMTFWYKANAGTVDHANDSAPLSTGDIDRYQIMIALTDWSEPHQVYTKEENTFLNYETNEGIIAFGEITSSDAVSEWTKATIELKYRSLDRIPRYIVIMAAASRYGDYFTGSTSSWMYLDDVELIYGDKIVLQD